MKTLDVRGLSCPEPVIKTKNELDRGEKELEILLDTQVSFENVNRFLESRGYSVKKEEVSGEYRLKAKKNA